MLYRLHSIDSKREHVISELSSLDDSYFDDATDCTGYYARRQELYAKPGLYVIELSENICRKFKIKHVSWEGGQSGSLHPGTFGSDSRIEVPCQSSQDGNESEASCGKTEKTTTRIGYTATRAVNDPQKGIPENGRKKAACLK